MMNEEDDPEQHVRFKPSESRMRLYLIKKEGDMATFDMEGAVLDFVAIMKTAGWDKDRFMHAVATTWDAAEIAYRFPSEERN